MLTLGVLQYLINDYELLHNVCLYINRLIMCILNALY